MLRACLEDGTVRFPVGCAGVMVSDSISGSQARWEAFIDALIADRELLTERIRKSIRAGLPAYRKSQTGSWTGAFGSISTVR